jgi:hypothetical protein
VQKIKQKSLTNFIESGPVCTYVHKHTQNMPFLKAAALEKFVLVLNEKQWNFSARF